MKRGPQKTGDFFIPFDENGFKWGLATKIAAHRKIKNVVYTYIPIKTKLRVVSEVPMESANGGLFPRKYGQIHRKAFLQMVEVPSTKSITNYRHAKKVNGLLRFHELLVEMRAREGFKQILAQIFGYCLDIFLMKI